MPSLFFISSEDWLSFKKGQTKNSLWGCWKNWRLHPLGTVNKACKRQSHSLTRKSRETKTDFQICSSSQDTVFLKRKGWSCNNKQRPRTVTAHGLVNTSLYLQTMFPRLKHFTELMAQWPWRQFGFHQIQHHAFSSGDKPKKFWSGYIKLLHEEDSRNSSGGFED